MSCSENIAEIKRLKEQKGGLNPWRMWGSYLSEREWGTVREDYSAEDQPWNYFPHDHARSKAYQWGEGGIAGLGDDGQDLCFALILWNGNDSILKERLFGLSNNRGNHSEDVKELYYHLDNTPKIGIEHTDDTRFLITEQHEEETENDKP